MNYNQADDNFVAQGDDEEDNKEKLALVKDEPRGRRQPQKQGSAIDLDIGPPLEPNQVVFCNRKYLNVRRICLRIAILNLQICHKWLFSSQGP